MSPRATITLLIQSEIYFLTALINSNPKNTEDLRALTDRLPLLPARIDDNRRPIESGEGKPRSNPKNEEIGLPGDPIANHLSPLTQVSGITLGIVVQTALGRWYQNVVIHELKDVELTRHPWLPRVIEKLALRLGRIPLIGRFVGGNQDSFWTADRAARFVGQIEEFLYRTKWDAAYFGFMALLPVNVTGGMGHGFAITPHSIMPASNTQTAAMAVVIRVLFLFGFAYYFSKFKHAFFFSGKNPTINSMQFGNRDTFGPPPLFRVHFLGGLFISGGFQAAFSVLSLTGTLGGVSDGWVWGALGLCYFIHASVHGRYNLRARRQDEEDSRPLPLSIACGSASFPDLVGQENQIPEA